MKNIITFGSEVKMTPLDGNIHEVTGFLVKFGHPDEADFAGDFFTKNTDFDLDLDATGKVTVYFNHGLDALLGKHKLNRGYKATLTLMDEGVWIDARLDEGIKYDALVAKLIREREAMGKSVGWSAGTLPHLFERHAIKTGIYEITSFPLGSDASITHTPADYRNKATYKTIELLPIQSSELPTDDSDSLGDAEAVQAKASNGETVKRGNVNIQLVSRGENMSDENNTQQQAQPDTSQLDQVIDSKVKTAMESLDGKLGEYRGEVKSMSDAINQLLQQMEDNPTVRKSGYFTQDGGEADPKIKSFGDFLMAVSRQDETRLKSVYGSHYKAQSGDSGAAGGYLIPQEFGTQYMNMVMRTSQVVSGVARQPVRYRSGSYPSLDVTTAPTAGGGESAEQAGVGTNTRAEGGAYTEETANFDMLKYNVTDIASGYLKAPRELIQEVAGIEALLRNMSIRSVTEKLERSILLGSGAGQPLGILNAPCAISLTNDVSGTFDVDDMAEIISRFKPMGGEVSGNNNSGGAWIMHRSMLPDLYAFEVGTGGSVWNTNPAQGPTNVLDGRPIIFSEHLAQADASGAVLLADLPSYVLFELGSMYIDFSEHADFLNGNSVWRFGARVDGKPLLNNAITLAGAGSAYTVSPFVFADD